MKRFVSVLLIAILAISLFAGCGGASDSDKSDSGKSVDLPAVMEKINSEYSLSLKALNGAGKLTRYYSIEVNDVKQFAAELDSNNNAPVEIVLVEAVDADAADRVESALTTRYNSILNQYGSYTPEKVNMVKACKVTKDGNFVSMIVADNADGMLKIYQDSIQ